MDKLETDDFIDHLQFLQYLETCRAPRKYLRDRGNPLEEFDDHHFFARYRFPKSTFLHKIFPLVKEDVESFDLRGLPILAVTKVLAVLRFYATGSYQVDVGDLHAISQTRISVLVQKLSRLFSLKIPQFVKFPHPSHLDNVKSQFHAKAGFPGVVACIDCTHIPVLNPGSKNRGEDFLNANGSYSINVQVACGPNREMYYIVCRWPGSVPDIKVFDASGVKSLFETGKVQGLLLGDGAYGQNDYFFTPVRDPSTIAEERYNMSHSDTMLTMKQFIREWKRRFPCLRKKLNNNITTSCHIVTACAVLHNIAVFNRVPCIEGDGFTDIQVEQPGHREKEEGCLIRSVFIDAHFN